MNHRELDKFYTKKEVIKTIVKKIDFDKYDLIIEPSAGSGNFLDFLPTDNTIAMDIEPENNKITKCSWFDYKIEKGFKKVLVIGNPPFGKINDLSKKFLLHAFSFNNVDTVAFILPNVYKKYTMQSIIPKEYRIEKIIELPKNSFTLENEEYHVPCSFFVIVKGDGKDLRQDKNIETIDFSFGTPSNYDFFIFGAAPHKSLDSPKKNNRGYYIKTGKIYKEKLIERFANMKWKGHSSANGGVAWFTKVDIIENYKREYHDN